MINNSSIRPNRRRVCDGSCGYLGSSSWRLRGCVVMRLCRSCIWRWWSVHRSSRLDDNGGSAKATTFSPAACLEATSWDNWLNWLDYCCYSKNCINLVQRRVIYKNSPGYRILIHQNLQYMKIIRISATAPSGAYWRNMACKLIFLAAFRYFSDSERKDVDRCDIPI